MAAIGAVVLAVVAVAYIFFGGPGGAYSVKARFQNAGQLVGGNLVQIGGTKAGTVDKIKITQDGQAEVTMKIDPVYEPLRRGTKAIVRQASLSGIANRYVDLQLPATERNRSSTGQRGDEIPDGGTIPVHETTTAVDLDQLFNTLDPTTRVAVQEFFKGGATQYRDYGIEGNRGFQYLNPALSTSRRLFNELNADTPLLERFIIDSAKFVTAVAERSDDLTGVVRNLNATFNALGNEREALRDAIRAFPDFMRSANGTFVTLRSTLDDVDPLVAESKKVAPKLARVLEQAQPFARDARPTIRDLNAIVRRPGRNNDLVELNRTFPPLAESTLETKTRSVKYGGERKSVGRTRGAFSELTQALRDSAPLIAFGRPYTADLFRWFDDFSNTGVYDALGGTSRAQVFLNVNSPSGGAPLVDIRDADPITPGDQPLRRLGDRAQVFRDFARYHQYKRCPGAAEERAPDGSNVWEGGNADFDRDGTVDCLEEDRATGNFR